MIKNHGHVNHKTPSEKTGHLAAAQPAKNGYSNLRKPQNPTQERVLHATALWILSLPADARPLSLAKKFPRIVNILAKDWADPASFEKRLAEYMINDRDKRQGFPLDVLMDLTNLNAHFMLVDSRARQCAWDGVLIR